MNRTFYFRHFYINLCGSVAPEANISHEVEQAAATTYYLTMFALNIKHASMTR